MNTPTYLEKNAWNVTNNAIYTPELICVEHVHVGCIIFVLTNEC
jgi:hypothetical protein